jgi:hypothetical protein
MLTDEQLADQLRAQLRREVATVEPSGDLLPSLRRRQSRRSLKLQVTIVGVPVMAAGVAVAVLVATGGSGSHGPTLPGVTLTVLTAKTVHKMASASRHALAHSGRVTIAYRQHSNGTLQATGRSSITFAGKNWNDVISQTFPAQDGQPAHTQSAINRIVDGQFYLYTEGRNGKAEWLRETNQTGHPKLTIPDPRTLFRLLNPSASFKIVGHRVMGGLRLTELRATTAPRLPPLRGLPGVTRGVHVTSLTVWVDRHNLVHQMSLRVTQHHTADPIYMQKKANGAFRILVPSKAFLKEAKAMARKMRAHYPHVTARVDPSLNGHVRHYFYVTSASVTFSDFGKRLVITAPKHSVPVFARG